ncbi:YciI family protein, partial [Methylobacterium crusticola]|uniref:YciI family protein n=1 Tax=Methylobacterium crusticola TaxID=1697972 RepID=UPI001FD4E2A1
MPHFIVHCLDHAGAAERRLAHYEAHKAYLAGPLPVETLVSGPLLAEDGATMIGSLFLLEAPDRAAVEAFHHADPFRAAGIWAEVRIHPFLKRVDRRGGAEARWPPGFPGCRLAAAPVGSRAPARSGTRAGGAALCPHASTVSRAAIAAALRGLTRRRRGGAPGS